MARHLKILTLLPLLPGIAMAQTQWQDPTRPPQVMLSGEGAAADAPASPLQSIRRPQQGKAVAVIDGKPYHVGDTWGERKIVRILDAAVELRGADGLSRLELTPGIEITPHVPAAVRSGRGNANNRRGQAAAGQPEATASRKQ